MDERPQVGPFDPLLDVPGVNGPQDIFGNLPSSGDGENPFSMGSSTNMSDLAYGGNPFAGDNFWNLFAGGVNPSNLSSNQQQTFGSSGF